MKKGLKLFATGLICMSVLVWNVKADEVSTEAELETCLAKDTATCTVTKEFEITKSHKITTGKDIIFDLNGNKVIGPDDGNGNWYAFIVDGGKLTLKDTSEAQTGELWAKCYGIETKTGTFIMESGKITATHNQKVGAAIVNYGGKAEVKGGTLVAASNWAVNAQAYFSDSELVINGGTFEVTSEVEAAVQVGGEYSVNKETVTINGGTFKGVNAFAVSSDTATVSITGGEFSSNVADYVAEGYKSIEAVDTKTGDVKYVVATETEIVETAYEVEEEKRSVEEFEAELKEMEKLLSEVNEEELDEEDLKEYQEIKSQIEEFKKALGGKIIASIHDIYYGSFIGNDYVTDSDKTELEKAVEVTLHIPTTLEKVKDGYTRKYSVIRIHETANDELLIDVLDATEKDGKVTFETDKFSVYLLTYEDVKNADNPDTYDGISLYIILGALSLIGVATVISFLKKEQKLN